MSGTPFTAGQLGKLQSTVSIAVSTALPKVAARFGDPKAVLKALSNKGQVLAGHLEGALEQAIKRMLVLVHRKRLSLVVSARHESAAFYKTRKGLWVYDGFTNLVASKAKPVEVGAKFAIDISEISAENGATNAEIEAALPANHLFDESAVCAIIAEMISKQPNGETGDLENTEYANLLYIASCVVGVYWYAGDARWNVDTWERGGVRWNAGNRVLSPAN